MEKQIFAKIPETPEGPWDVIIIGSGPAAFTAAIYTTRGAASTLILGGEVWGGQPMTTTVIDNYPGFPEGVAGSDLMMKMKDQSERFGACFKGESVNSVDFSKKPFEVGTRQMKYLGRSVIVATGAQTMWLDVPGAKELIGKGVSSCAPCDAPFFKDKKVAVVGGGDSAMEEASVLTKYAREVVIIHRRDEFKASMAMQEKVKSNPKIKILWNTEVTEIKGEAKLESITLKNNVTGEVLSEQFDGLFVAIGHRPTSEIFEGVLDRDEKGYITAANWHCGTSVAGVFTAGDVMDKHFRQVIVSSGTGCIAAMEALKFLEET